MRVCGTVCIVRRYAGPHSMHLKQKSMCTQFVSVFDKH